ncbi:geranyltranstransferase [Listeria fleischmannii 1991]|uniref:Farnesyl diphosphate synthase n=2 Tax=Listeria fleischmannii TaxID=1069827 RepID=A0A0J8J8C8_9LIST|nr:farnesyl diphosphate synthase [Listeria fleischmannii]EMG28132.1 putative geranyltranstransferase [Listeria fleischmannii subsp. fleischmannii LU2006-1]KMT60596.1 geranyltranstransferase [Listeria fleischmannii 1991]
MTDLRMFMDTYKAKLEERLFAAVQNEAIEPKLKEAMHYSLLAGGKRIRPLLLFATIDALRGDKNLGLHAASAVEMIHTYSLIHDDLPAMDDDDYRRGQLTSHKKFDEGTAILAGDALLTMAFSEIASDETINAEKRIKIVQRYAKNAGALGMVGGQQADLMGENRDLTLEELKSIHARKTGALLHASVYAGSVLGDATQEEQERLSVYAEQIGIAFQICDDILDVTGDTAKLGKETGSDEKKQKSTYPNLLTLEGAKKALNEHYALAIAALVDSGLKTDYLIGLADLIVKRDN